MIQTRRENEDVKLVRCEYCPYKQPPGSVEIHTRQMKKRMINGRHPVEGIMPCQQCDRVYVTFQTFSRHMHDDHDQTGFMCKESDKCLKFFQGTGELRQHVKLEHEPPPQSSTEIEPDTAANGTIVEPPKSALAANGDVTALAQVFQEYVDTKTAEHRGESDRLKEKLEEVRYLAQRIVETIDG